MTPTPTHTRERRRADDLAPDPEMWEALERGPKLRRILEDFYAQVFADPRLLPFFEHTTLSWVLDHQFAFLNQIFTGDDVYWGYRPRNAHHWMVISDELFDHREALMEATLRRHGVPEHLVTRWRAMEERFRKQIVKSAPRPLKLHGQEMPLEGWDTIELAMGSLCDGCEEERDAGERMTFHVRTGKLYCARCVPPPPPGGAGAAP